MRVVAEAPPDASLAADVRRHDHDRYLCALFAPAHRRPALVALLALNLELGRIRGRVGEPMLGRIRLAWWRETVDGVFAGTPRRHPVAGALAEAVARHPIPREALAGMIDAREREFAGRGFPSFEALDRFASGTSGGLQRACLAVLGVDAPEAATAADHVGAALALIGAVRGVPRGVRMGRVCLPLDALAEAGLDVDGLSRPGAGARLAPVVETIVDGASRRVRQARDLRRDVPSGSLPALLPAVLVESYARELRRCGYDPFALGGESGRLRRQLRLFRAWFRKRY